MKASILAVGSELLSGQITNRNATWISKQLSSMGVQTEIHVTVADDRKAIREALNWIENKAELLFVTGGLGPTSDDFTRELVTEWAGLPLEFHDPSWKKIQERLSSRGIPVAEFQKQQCLFPKGSQVLENPQGTANAFYLDCRNKRVWVLPGPPNEIEAVWGHRIQMQLTSLTQNLDRFVTYSWDALGLGEAVAPTLIEPAVKGSGGELGYRVHPPYLEIKFSFFSSQTAVMKPYVEKIESALSSYVINRNGDDIVTLMLNQIPKTAHLFVQDGFSQGVLFSRLSDLRKQNLTFTTDKNLTPPYGAWQIICHFVNDFEFELELKAPDRNAYKKVITSSLHHSPQMSERRRQYLTEMAFLETYLHWRA
jgi:molybdenum cofactor synthesis domain-containing protein